MECKQSNVFRVTVNNTDPMVFYCTLVRNGRSKFGPVWQNLQRLTMDMV